MGAALRDRGKNPGGRGKASGGGGARVAREEGEREGEGIGMRRGLKEGRKEGRIEVARAALVRELDVGMVAEISGLSEGEIVRLKAEKE